MGVYPQARSIRFVKDIYTSTHFPANLRDRRRLGFDKDAPMNMAGGRVTRREAQIESRASAERQSLRSRALGTARTGIDPSADANGGK